MAATIDGQDKVLATAQRIVQSLNASQSNVNTDDMLRIFSSFDNRLSNISSLMNNKSISSSSPSRDVNDYSTGGGSGDFGGDSSVVDPQFEAAESVILRWDSHGGDGDTEEYLAAVDEIIRMTEEMSIGLGGEEEGDDGVADRAESALQMAMARLEDEFRQILVQNIVPLDLDRLHSSSSLSRRCEIPSLEDVTAEDPDDLSSGRYSHARAVSLGVNGELCHDLINPDAIVLLKEIADRVVRSGYEKECCQVYSSVRRDVLDECLSVLGVDKLSIEEVQRIEWKTLDDKMRTWIQALKILARVILTGEKRLCEQIFTGSELIREVCFVETAKGCVMQLLNFGEAVAICKRSSEKLFRILDMYDALSDVMPDLEELFSDEDAGEMVCSEAKGVLDALGEAAIGTFVEFENAVRGEASKKPIPNGDIHPLTRYVMNYVKLLGDYCETLNGLLEKIEDYTEELQSVGSGNGSGSFELEKLSPIAARMLSLLKCLESNLEEKSRMYEEGGLQYVFLMNNILYVVQKVKDSELRNILGDQWIRKRRGQIRQYATSYLRASWSKVLACLKDEGIGGSSNSASKVALKERFRNFNACFEDIYRLQTAWKVPDPQLREELRISISEKAIPAYRSFLGRFGSHLESGRHAGKYIKYVPEDLENYLLDLFEGTPLILHHLKRKNT